MARLSKDEAFEILCSKDPMTWRCSLEIEGKPWGGLMSPVQIKDFQALDPAFLHLSDPSNPRPKVRRFWLQRSRGYSKSTDIASCLLWLTKYSKRRIPGWVVAEDRDQAQLVRDAMSDIIRANPGRLEGVDLQRKMLANPSNGVELSFASSDVKSSFGGRPLLTFADEFTHWTKSDMWTTVLSSYGKEADKGGVLIVGCNAGFGRNWHWRAKEEAMSSALWYHSAPHGSSPWYTQEMLDEQRRGLSIEEYSRLWLNEWQDSEGTFVSLTEADACVDPERKRCESADDVPPLYHGGRVNTFVASLDYAEKHDRTVGTVMHQEGNRVIVDRMDVVVPEEQDNSVVPVEWCAAWVEKIQENFGKGKGGVVYFVIDPYQLKWLTSHLKQQDPFDLFIEEWNHHGGNGNFDLSRVLRHLILQKQVVWYPDCGKIKSKQGMRDDLSTELSTLYVKTMSGNRWRLEHQRGDHDDRAFSLGAGCAFIVKNNQEWGVE